jgi:hypothetical protein
MVANKVMVQVKGDSGVTDDALRSYLKGIKFAEIEEAAQ